MSSKTNYFGNKAFILKTKYNLLISIINRAIDSNMSNILLLITRIITKITTKCFMCNDMFEFHHQYSRSKIVTLYNNSVVEKSNITHGKIFLRHSSKIIKYLI